MKKRKCSSYSLKMIMTVVTLILSAVFVNMFIAYAANLMLRFLVVIASIAGAALITVLITICMFLILDIQIEDENPEE